mmetsp:Transcript_6185/g.20183  ORF Transcript_6185/g.20183 Transcript_6185/m.20183 type:complete len:293 (+) Transcript_6185:488-1366(+)
MRKRRKYLWFCAPTQLPSHGQLCTTSPFATNESSPGKVRSYTSSVSPVGVTDTTVSVPCSCAMLDASAAVGNEPVVATWVATRPSVMSAPAWTQARTPTRATKVGSDRGSVSDTRPSTSAAGTAKRCRKACSTASTVAGVSVGRTVAPTRVQPCTSTAKPREPSQAARKSRATRTGVPSARQAAESRSPGQAAASSSSWAVGASVTVMRETMTSVWLGTSESARRYEPSAVSTSWSGVMRRDRLAVRSSTVCRAPMYTAWLTRPRVDKVPDSWCQPSQVRLAWGRTDDRVTP